MRKWHNELIRKIESGKRDFTFKNVRVTNDRKVYYYKQLVGWYDGDNEFHTFVITKLRPMSASTRELIRALHKIADSYHYPIVTGGYYKSGYKQFDHFTSWYGVSITFYFERSTVKGMLNELETLGLYDLVEMNVISLHVDFELGKYVIVTK